VTAPALNPHDILRTDDGQLHTVVDAPTDGPVLVAEWTGQTPHRIGGYTVVYRHHGRS
jgi:hypothetical protein